MPAEVAEEYGNFIIAKDEEVLGAVRAKTREFDTLSLLKLLYQLRSQSMTFSMLYSQSRIRMKRSFLNYLRLCVACGFVSREPKGVSVNYTITCL